MPPCLTFGIVKSNLVVPSPTPRFSSYWKREPSGHDPYYDKNISQADCFISHTGIHYRHNVVFPLNFYIHKICPFILS